jgi:5-methyltetrahydropteroyltriglutamate--homocysteine methyltransferase
MQHSTDRILTTHVGSLVRPTELAIFLRAREDRVAVDEQAFESCLHAAVQEVVRRQIDAGLDVINDGEFAKTQSWSRYILERMNGFAPHDPKAGEPGVPAAIRGKDRRDFAAFYADYDPKQGLTNTRTWAVTGPISYRGHTAVQHDIAELKSAVEGTSCSAVFMTAVAPGSVAPDRVDQHYGSERECLFAIADALHEEYQAIVEAGFILQIDDAYLASYYDIIVPPGTMADYRKWAALRVDALNHALRGLPEDRTRYHMCWGSWNGPHVTDVPLADIVDLVLAVRTGGYALELANPRHEHEWRLWETVKLPAGKVLIPGVISHSTNVVEHPALVAERITRLARLVGRENVVAGTDCGFAQGPFVQRVHPTIMWAKLQALTDGARLATRELWGRG